ncbi:MAG: hypothetical protein ACYC6L_02235 [Anaerolineae bacterium]
MPPELPAIKCTGIDCLVHDANHNAFTDLTWFKNSLYLCFRSCPDGHMLYTSSGIVILKSDDRGATWQRVCHFSVPGRDVRDPHWLVFNDRLYCFTGTWLVTDHAPDSGALADHRGYAVFSPDGFSWHGPLPLAGTDGCYIWRAAACGGAAYLNARRFSPGTDPGKRSDYGWDVESLLLTSTDGFSWQPGPLLMPEGGDETAFYFDAGGTLHALARGQDKQPATLITGQPSYEHLERAALDRNLGGPLLARWESRVLAAGRDTDPRTGQPCTAVFWIDQGELVPALTLLSGGDTSYPGFAALDDRHALLSFYSSHEGSGSHLAPSYIYLARLELV